MLQSNKTFICMYLRHICFIWSQLPIEWNIGWNQQPNNSWILPTGLWVHSRIQHIVKRQMQDKTIHGEPWGVLMFIKNSKLNVFVMEIMLCNYELCVTQVWSAINLYWLHFMLQSSTGVVTFAKFQWNNIDKKVNFPMSTV